MAIRCCVRVDWLCECCLVNHPEQAQLVNVVVISCDLKRGSISVEPHVEALKHEILEPATTWIWKGDAVSVQVGFIRCFSRANITIAYSIRPTCIAWVDHEGRYNGESLGELHPKPLGIVSVSGL